MKAEAPMWIEYRKTASGTRKLLEFLRTGMIVNGR